MKSTFFVFGIVFATLVSATSFAATQSSDESLRQVKELFDRGALHLTMQPNCVKPGYSCKSSGDCCGASFCDDGACSGVNCQPVGAPCTSSGSCCGAMFCNDGRCDDGSVTCYPTGSVCHSSGECCGASFCDDGVCS